jgi:hypothetical protein
MQRGKNDPDAIAAREQLADLRDASADKEGKLSSSDAHSVGPSSLPADFAARSGAGQTRRSRQTAGADAIEGGEFDLLADDSSASFAPSAPVGRQQSDHSDSYSRLTSKKTKQQQQQQQRKGMAEEERTAGGSNAGNTAGRVPQKNFHLPDIQSGKDRWRCQGGDDDCDKLLPPKPAGGRGGRVGGVVGAGQASFSGMPWAGDDNYSQTHDSLGDGGGGEWEGRRRRRSDDRGDTKVSSTKAVIDELKIDMEQKDRIDDYVDGALQLQTAALRKAGAQLSRLRTHNAGLTAERDRLDAVDHDLNCERASLLESHAMWADQTRRAKQGREDTVALSFTPEAMRELERANAEKSNRVDDLRLDFRRKKQSQKDTTTLTAWMESLLDGLVQDPARLKETLADFSAYHFTVKQAMAAGKPPAASEQQVAEDNED